MIGQRAAAQERERRSGRALSLSFSSLLVGDAAVADAMYGDHVVRLIEQDAMFADAQTGTVPRTLPRVV